MPAKILLNGCNGQMGKVISSSLAEDSSKAIITCGLDINDRQNFAYPVFKSTKDLDVDFDVIIDFSHPSSVKSIVEFADSQSKPIVIATTGLDQETKDLYMDLAGRVPVFVSANMSLGVNMLMKLAAEAAQKLYDKFDIEIYEFHHRRKIDAPSGTAYMIADHIKEAIGQVGGDDYQYVYDRHSLNERRKTTDIGIASMRGGTIPGEHTVLFAGDEETIELTHRAQSRDIFAKGAITAALYISKLPAGLYNMENLLAGI